MDGATVQQIVQALERVYAANTAAADRKAAETECQQFKDDARAVAYGLYLAQPSNAQSPMVRYFGLQLIEHAIKQRFGTSKMPTEEALQLREQIWELVFASGQSDAREPQFIREKLVAILVMLVIRLWPSEQWTDLSAQLMHLYSQTAGHRELALRVWQTLGEELLVYDRDALATVRKHELTNGIVGALLPKSAVMELYPNGYRLSTDPGVANPATAKGGKRATLIVLEPGNEDGWILRWMQHAGEVAQQQSGGLSDEHEAQIVQLLETTATFLDWMPIKAVVATELVPRLAALLGVRSARVRQHAAAALEIVSRRNVPAGEERDAILLQFVEAGDGAALGAIAQAYATTLAPQLDAHWDDAGDALACARALAQISANLTTLHWARKKLESNVVRQPERLVELLLALSRDARHSVSALVLPSWAAVVQHSVLSRTPQVAAAFSALTEHTTEAIFRVCRAAQALAGAGSADGIVDEADAEQFDSVGDLRLFLAGEVRSRLLNIVRGMCALDPAGFVGWIMPSLAPALASDDAAVAEAALMTVEAMLATLDDVEQRALADGDEDACARVRQARAPCYELGRRVVDVAGASAAACVRQLNTLPAFAFLLRPAAMDADEARGLLWAILQKCAQYLAPALDAPDARELRTVARRATAALVRLAVAVPDSLMLVYDDLSQLVRARIADAAVSAPIKGHLSEFLLALIAGASCSLAQRRQLARPVVQPLLDALRDLAPALQQPADFAALLGLPALDHACARGIDANTSRALLAARDARGRVLQMLSTLYVCLNRTLGAGAALTPLWSECAPELVPPLLLLARCLHALWSPAARTNLPWESREARESLFGVLDMSPAECASIVGLAADTDAADAIDGAAGVQLAAETGAVRHALGTLRERTYKCIGRLAAMPATFEVADLPANFAACLFADAESLAARHWRFLLADVAAPVLMHVGNWPGVDAESGRATAARFADAWLRPLFAFCTRRLDAEWAELLAHGMAPAAELEQAGAEQMSVTDEIVHERIVRDWTRAWSQLVAELLASVAHWIPGAAQIENELASGARSPAQTSPKAGNPALGAYVLGSGAAFSDTLATALAVLRYKDAASVRRVLLQLGELAPALALVALMPMYAPPTPAHASVCAAYTARISSAVAAADDACSGAFTWLATDLASALLHVLRDVFLLDQQDAALALLADLLYYSASLASDRMPQHWAIRNSSGDIDQRAAAAGGARIAPVGDPGRVFRRALLQTMRPALEAAQISADELELTIEELACVSLAKRRRALLKAALLPMLAVETSQLFSQPQPTRVANDSALSRTAPQSWTNKHADRSTSLLDTDAQFDLGSIMP